jgi:AcrR family transcriptional regulator
MSRPSTEKRARSPGSPGRARAPKTEKRHLDRERIELAALELVEESGLAEFSMRKLGAVLGVEAMSLYHHFPSKAHLFDALVDRLITSVVEAPGATGSWRERARRMCIAYRALGFRYPEFSRYMIVHRMNTRASLAWLESIARIFTEAGFDIETAARAFRSMGYYMMGAVLDETAGYARGPSAVDPVPPSEQAEIAPTAARMGPYFGREHWDRTFSMGLDLLFDGFERQLRRAPTVATDDC